MQSPITFDPLRHGHTLSFILKVYYWNFLWPQSQNLRWYIWWILLMIFLILTIYLNPFCKSVYIALEMCLISIFEISSTQRDWAASADSQGRWLFTFISKQGNLERDRNLLSTCAMTLMVRFMSLPDRNAACDSVTHPQGFGFTDRRTNSKDLSYTRGMHRQ